ncbi:bis(5'-nucleosyl)-tetraphosphatase (symmetrical) YqeK [Lachnospira multipara]|uniref:bis(5'-nucleosyl)-tetraphosphatase (symmetrical) YqeK n=1 Tax=Lachnospira multipara TaxID=28051 RepID=UPI0004809C1C|nr:bis(5'-nucleosyl)-tetraphosphatase (symmetrical) YqeK [Lachnospira multipara]
MDNAYIDELCKKVQEALKDDYNRFKHSIGVANTAACLAMRYNSSMERAYIAGLLHDCAKCVPDDIKIEECKRANLSISEIEYKSPYLLHSKLGALYAKEKYNIDDKEICSAIEYHTTGKPDMSILEKIIFIADYIEPYRNKAWDVDIIRGLAFEDINEAVYFCLKDTLEYLESSNKDIDEMTSKAYAYYASNRLENI